MSKHANSTEGKKLEGRVGGGTEARDPDYRRSGSVEGGGAAGGRSSFLDPWEGGTVEVRVIYRVTTVLKSLKV